MRRRRFLVNAGVGGATALIGTTPSSAVSPQDVNANGIKESAEFDLRDQSSAIDFRYAPANQQTAYCFPDDKYKSLIGQSGELRYGHLGKGKGGNAYFPTIVEFSLLGVEALAVKYQKLEAPGIPIIHTRLDAADVIVELITFATNGADEGRVDNVIMEIRPKSQKQIRVVPRLTLRTNRAIITKRNPSHSFVHLDGETSPLFLAADAPPLKQAAAGHNDFGLGRFIYLNEGTARSDKPLRYLLRFPQEGQDFEKIKAKLATPDLLLSEARTYWQSWQPFAGEVSWNLASRHGEFLAACARNILQAREIKDGRATFQVGPTVYRGLWVADGHFLLEAARYMGRDTEAQQGLESTWAQQSTDGKVSATAQTEHWKDTAIAMFTMVRQAELSQDWQYFRRMQPNLHQAVKFLIGVRDQARKEEGANGRYGLLARGFGDGGLRGVRSEFTNTLWALAGLKAVTEAADNLKLSGFESAKRFYSELRGAFINAAQQEMREHPGGFKYLPMVMGEDNGTYLQGKELYVQDEWERPRPQTAQWALAQSIYPGLIFQKSDPLVNGYIALMQACTREAVPAETGFLPHGGVWTYDAAFAAHVYLWAGRTDLARQTFTGFLNHASPLYCWREEQPLKGTEFIGTSEYIGDMPHNWASAECVLFLRHMLALEDGALLRLLAGIDDFELAAGEPYVITGSPTRFGRVSLNLEPLDRHRGWRLAFRRGQGPAPSEVQLPINLGSRFRFSKIIGSSLNRQGNVGLVAPEATNWVATWELNG